MKNSLVNVNQRRETIINHLYHQNDLTMSVNDLAEIMNVSSMTIRRDLDILEKMGKVIRNHGSATINTQQKNEGYTENQSLELIKQNLAKQAAKYVKDGMTLFINSSSTALRAFDYLEDRILTLVTNNLRVDRNNVHLNTNIILPGGEIRFPKKALVGDLCVTNLSVIQSDIAIIGCSGLSAEKGISTNNIHEHKVNKVMIENTNDLVILVCDYRKIGNDSTFMVADITSIDILITDEYANPKALKAIEDKGVTIVQVNA